MLPKIIAVDQDMLSNFRSRLFVLTAVIVDDVFRNFYANKAMKAFFLEKTSPSPTLPFLHENLKAGWRSLLFEYVDRARFLEKSSQVFENFNRRYAS
jgi:hypothetical protein